MADQPGITRIDPGDPRVVAAAAAERQLFAHYGLTFQEHYVELTRPRLRVRVLEVGAGEPLLVVPGGSGDAWQLVALMAQLRGWRLLAVNRPGGGLSDAIDYRQVDLRRFAVHTLASVLDALGLERVAVIGSSMGGLWSFWLALDQPDRVSRLVQLGCPGLILTTSAPFVMRLLGVPGLGRLLAPSLQPRRLDKALDGLRLQGTRPEVIDAAPAVLAETAYRFFHLPTYVDTWRTLVAATTTLRGAEPAYRLGADQLERVQQPVLLIWGDQDPFGALTVAREAAASLPDARLEVVAAGHLPFVDNPAACGSSIRAFLSAPV